MRNIDFGPSPQRNFNRRPTFFITTEHRKKGNIHYDIDISSPKNGKVPGRKALEQHAYTVLDEFFNERETIVVQFPLTDHKNKYVFDKTGRQLTEKLELNRHGVAKIILSLRYPETTFDQHPSPSAPTPFPKTEVLDTETRIALRRIKRRRIRGLERHVTALEELVGQLEKRALTSKIL